MNLYLHLDGCTEEEFRIVDEECVYIDGKCYKDGVEIEDPNYIPDDPFDCIINEFYYTQIRNNLFLYLDKIDCIAAEYDNLGYDWGGTRKGCTYTITISFTDYDKNAVISFAQKVIETFGSEIKKINETEVPELKTSFQDEGEDPDSIDRVIRTIERFFPNKEWVNWDRCLLERNGSGDVSGFVNVATVIGLFSSIVTLCTPLFTKLNQMLKQKRYANDVAILQSDLSNISRIDVPPKTVICSKHNCEEYAYKMEFSKGLHHKRTAYFPVKGKDRKKYHF